MLRAFDVACRLTSTSPLVKLIKLRTSLHARRFTGAAVEIWLLKWMGALEHTGTLTDIFIVLEDVRAACSL